MTSLQVIHERTAAISDEAWNAGCEAWGKSDAPGLTTFNAARQKVHAKYAEEISRLQTQCASMVGHLFLTDNGRPDHICVCCGHDKDAARAVLSANLLKTA